MIQWFAEERLIFLPTKPTDSPSALNSVGAGSSKPPGRPRPLLVYPLVFPGRAPSMRFCLTEGSTDSLNGSASRRAEG